MQIYPRSNIFSIIINLRYFLRKSKMGKNEKNREQLGENQSEYSRGSAKDSDRYRKMGKKGATHGEKKETRALGKKYGKKRMRVMLPDSKWGDQDLKKACLFYAIQIINNPYRYSIWRLRKEDGFFQKMADHTGKTRKQCKSFDQQIRDKHKMKNLGDFIEFLSNTLRDHMTEDDICRQTLEELRETIKQKEEQEQEMIEFLQENMEQEQRNLKIIDEILNTLDREQQNQRLF